MKKLLVIIISIVLLNTASSFADSTFVSGIIDGQTWTPSGSPYIMEGDLVVTNLVIQPGVKIISIGDYEIQVTGIITAIGTQQDSIIFTRIDTINSWKGIYFYYSTFPSHLENCKIEYSNNAGIRIRNSTPTIRYCTFENNTNSAAGGAIDIYNDTVTGSEFNLKGCEFLNNNSSNHGGALHVSLEGGMVILDSTYFTGNIANYSVINNGNFVGGAMYLEIGSATISNSDFIQNVSYAKCSSSFNCSVTARGGALYLGSSGNVDIYNNTFRKNQTHAQNNGNCFFGGSSNSYGAAIYVEDGTATIYNNIFAHNTTTWTNCNPSDAGGGIFVNGGTVNVINCTIGENNDATGIHGAGGTLEIMNSILYDNNGATSQIGGTYTISYSCIQNGDTSLGVITGNPVFVDTLFHLSSISPCIDSGNPDTVFNDVCFPPSKGTERNDMGAYGGQNACGWEAIPSIIENKEIAGIATQYLLFHNYPNPFNPTTHIRFGLPKASKVNIEVYNSLGQRVAELLNEQKPAGYHSIQFDGSNLSSGVYFYKIQAGLFTQVRKMLLVK